MAPYAVMTRQMREELVEYSGFHIVSWFRAIDYVSYEMRFDFPAAACGDYRAALSAREGVNVGIGAYHILLRTAPNAFVADLRRRR